ncbi:MAG TPA: YihY/virulence factor BrkB family protein [Candidatus Omnitrophica bacterium]|nr:YihY/virulence factor BrkB family protein [Candidatus Omnitrophota bacterium]
MLSRIIRFIRVEIWRVRLSKLDGKRLFLIRPLMVIILAVRGFDEDKCLLRASALTFYSLLAIVPVVAMAFGIAQGFGIEDFLQSQLVKGLQGQEEVAKRIIEFAHSLLEKTKGGVVAGIGVVLLFWTVIRVLSNIEHSFNEIWGIKKGRSLGRKFSDYLAIMLISPILLIVITSQIELIIQRVPLLDAFNPILKPAQYVVIWIMFTFVYIFMPNTKVSLKSGILGGIAAGTMYQLLQWGYIKSQIVLNRYGAIYGSFAALPLFLIWLQISWLIVLFGAEVSFAHQNVETYEFEPDCLRVSYSFKKLLSLRIVHMLVKNFSEGRKPLTAGEISAKLETPVRLVNEILYELVEAGIIAETRVENEKTVAYQPALDSEVLTTKFVIDSLEERGSDNIPVAKSKELEKLAECLRTFSETLKDSPANTLLRDI